MKLGFGVVGVELGGVGGECDQNILSNILKELITIFKK